MNHFCKGCQTNWKQLWRTEVEEGDEGYEYCPICSSAIDLEHNDEETSPSFIKCRITGRVYDPATGIDMTLPERPIVVGKRFVKVPKANVVKRTPDHEQKEDEEIAAYIAMCAEGGKEIATKTFLKQ